MSDWKFMKLEHTTKVDLTKLELSDRYVSMSNRLTRAAHGLSLPEKRVLSAAIAKLDSVKIHRPGEPLVVRVAAADYANAFGLDTTTAYEQLKDAGDKLFNRYIRFVEVTTHKGVESVKETKIRWVGRATYYEGEGWIEISFFHELIPHLTGLRNQYTSYKLKQASSLRSVYSWRLLELFSQFKDTGVLAIGIDEFARVMDVPESYQKDFKALRIRVIEPAVSELRQKDNLVVEWEARRQGTRKVTSLLFRFSPNPQSVLDLES